MGPDFEVPGGQKSPSAKAVHDTRTQDTTAAVAGFRSLHIRYLLLETATASDHRRCLEYYSSGCLIQKPEPK